MTTTPVSSAPTGLRPETPPTAETAVPQPNGPQPDSPPREPDGLDAAERLRRSTAALRLSFTWFGTRKTLTPDQKARAAQTFGAQHDFLSAGKKLLDTRHPLFQAVTAVRNRAVRYWKHNSLPFPEPGVRLVRRRDLQTLDACLQRFRHELQQAVERLDRHFDQLQLQARQVLGELFDPQDYPDSLQDQFQMTWDFPSVEPPAWLQWLDPELYRRESQRVAARFDEAVRLAEQAFLQELSRLVAHLTERLTGSDDGRPKVFRDSAVENLHEFFERFRRLNVRSNPELDELVEQARRILGGVGPQQLRDSQSLRQQVARGLSELQPVLDELLVDQPRRRILRRPR